VVQSGVLHAAVGRRRKSSKHVSFDGSDVPGIHRQMFLVVDFHFLLSSRKDFNKRGGALVKCIDAAKKCEQNQGRRIARLEATSSYISLRYTWD
jgi:hypothetical protein